MDIVTFDSSPVGKPVYRDGKRIGTVTRIRQYAGGRTETEITLDEKEDGTPPTWFTRFEDRVGSLEKKIDHLQQSVDLVCSMVTKQTPVNLATLISAFTLKEAIHRFLVDRGITVQQDTELKGTQYAFTNITTSGKSNIHLWRFPLLNRGGGEYFEPIGYSLRYKLNELIVLMKKNGVSKNVRLDEVCIFGSSFDDVHYAHVVITSLKDED
jgi:hypothetical protein